MAKAPNFGKRPDSREIKKEGFMDKSEVTSLMTVLLKHYTTF